MDPLTERVVLDCPRTAAGRTAVQGGITVITSHRMSAARDADLRIVSGEGRNLLFAAWRNVRMTTEPMLPAPPATPREEEPR
jgi:hypothetical protein